MSAAERLKHAQAAQQQRAALAHQRAHQAEVSRQGAVGAGPRKTVEEQLAEAAAALDMAGGGAVEHLEEDQL